MADSAEQAGHAGPVDAPSEEDVSEILTEWRQRIRGSPDIQPREGLRGQRERSLTKALLEAAEAKALDGRSPATAEGAAQEEALRKLAMVAALYGADYPRDRLDPGALCEELGHLRQAVWHHLRQTKLDRQVVTDRILAFDRALTVALRAALTGGFRCEPEQFPEWRANLDAIVAESVSDSVFPGASSASNKSRPPADGQPH